MKLYINNLLNMQYISRLQLWKYIHTPFPQTWDTSHFSPRKKFDWFKVLKIFVRSLSSFDIRLCLGTSLMIEDFITQVLVQPCWPSVSWIHSKECHYVSWIINTYLTGLITCGLEPTLNWWWNRQNFRNDFLWKCRNTVELWIQ